MSSDYEGFEGVINEDINSLSRHFRIIGRGSSRVIFALDRNTVLKVPISLRGKYQSRVENKVYTNAGEDLKNYLCPILVYDNNRLIMKRAETVNYRMYPRNTTILNILPWEYKEEYRRDINKLIKDFDLLQADLLRLSSWGMYMGRFVLVDYGCTNRLFDEFY